MNDTLKVAGRIGAELGAAKAEVERLREALRPFAAFEAVRSKQGGCTPKRGTAWAVASAGEEAEITVEHLQEAVAALSQQPEPTDTFTAVEMATAAAQGFRDGQAAVEQAAAQGERKTFEVEIPDISAIYDGRSFIPYRSLEAGERLMTVAQHLRIEKQLRAALTRPAQTAPQSEFGDAYQGAREDLAIWKRRALESEQKVRQQEQIIDHLTLEAQGETRMGEPVIPQTAPQGKFRMGDLVKKSTGSEWIGRVVGWYSTEQTKEGYAVESSAHRNSVQIYPAKALELVPMAAKEA